MFGTIGHVRVKAGNQPQLDALLAEWRKTIRPQIPGSVLQISGASVSNPGEYVFIALMQDEATYRALAENPAQDVWFHQMIALIEGDVKWEDVNLDITLQD